MSLIATHILDSALDQFAANHPSYINALMLRNLLNHTPEELLEISNSDDKQAGWFNELVGYVETS